MGDGVFVTGGSGFVGRRLLTALRMTGRPVMALDRSGMLSQASSALAGIAVVKGDLLEPDTYRDSLRSCDVVLHLAAATGRASAEEHTRVNTRGTEVLLDECRKAGVRKLLFVSSIATTFPDTTGYSYAQTKRRAEEAVRRSGRSFAILRPTIVLGPGAPILKALEKLALLPVIVLPGNGRARVQPIHVDDLVQFILAAVRHDMFANETFEIGGPDTVTIEELLQRLRQVRRGAAGRVLHVPMGLIQAPLRAAEAMGLGRLLPISAGQLSSFRCDGLAARGRLQESLGAELIGVPQMLAGTAEDPAAGVHPLDAECQVFTRYLLGCDPDDYVRARYAAAHAAVPALMAASRFDQSLIAFARIGPLHAKVADSYASLFSPGAALRKRLVLLLAILETCPPFHQTIDSAIGGSTPLLLARLFARGLGAMVSLMAGTLIFLPARAVLALTRKGAG